MSGDAERPQRATAPTTRVSRQRSHHPAKAIAMTVLGTGFISINDASMKWVLAELPVGQAIFLRGLFCLLPIAVMIWRAGGWPALRPARPAGQALSAGLLIVALFLFITSLSYLPLALATIMVYASPLFLTAMAPFLLGERVGWRRWSAVALGFLGTILIIQPGSAGFTLLLLLPLAAAFLSALRDAVTRNLVASETSVSILAFSNVAITLCALPIALAVWVPPSGEAIAVLALAALTFGLGIFLMTETFRYADASLVSPYRYGGVIWALIIGFLVWQDEPTASVLAGAALIIASGLFILWRERAVAGPGDKPAQSR